MSFGDDVKGFFSRVGRVLEAPDKVITGTFGFLSDLVTAPWNDDEEFDGFWHTLKQRGETRLGGEVVGGVFGPEYGLGAAIGGLPEAVRSPARGIINPTFHALDTAYSEIVSQPLTTLLDVSGEVNPLLGGDGDVTKLFQPSTWSDAYHLAEHRSPGRAAVDNLTGTANALGVMDDADEQAFRETDAYSVMSGFTDAASRIFLDPTIVGGKAAAAAKLRYVDKPITAATNMDEVVTTARYQRFREDVKKRDVPSIATRYFADNEHQAAIATLLKDASKSDEDFDAVTRILMGDVKQLDTLAERRADLAGQAGRLLDTNSLLRRLQAEDPITQIELGFDVMNSEARIAAYSAEVEKLYPEIHRYDRLMGVLTEEAPDVAGAIRFEPRVDTLGSVKERAREVIRQGGPFAAPVRVITRYRPNRYIDANRPDGHIQLSRMLDRVPEMDDASRSRLLTDYMTQTDPAGREMMARRAEAAALKSIADAHGLSGVDELLQQMATKGRDKTRSILEQRRSYDGQGKDLFLDDDGIPFRAPILVSQTTNYIPLADLDEVRRLLARHESTIRDLMATPGEFLSWGADIFYRVWKPAALLRLGWPVRVVTDEMLRTVAVVGALADGQMWWNGVRNTAANRIVRPIRSARGRALAAGIEDNAQAALAARLAGQPQQKTLERALRDGDIFPDEFADLVVENIRRGRDVPADYAHAFANFRAGNITRNEMDELLQERAFARIGNDANVDRDLQTALDKLNVDKLLAEAKREQNPGFTYDVMSGELRDAGYGVAIKPNLERGIPLESFDAKHVGRYIKDHIDELRKPGYHLGAYVADGHVYLDVSYVERSRLKAQSLAWAHEQDSIWDIGYRGPDGERGREILSDPAGAARRRQNSSGEGPARAGQGRLAKGRVNRVGVGKIQVGEYTFEDVYGTFDNTNQNIYRQLASAQDASLAMLQTEAGRQYRQMRRASGVWDELAPDDPRFGAAYERLVNEHYGQDAVARKLLEGKSTDEVVEWLTNSKEGQLIGKQLPIRYSNPARWVELVEDRINTYLPTEELRTAALSGSASHEMLAKAYPELRDRPYVNGQIDMDVLGKHPFEQKLTQIVDKTFDVLGRAPTDTLVRHPFMAALYRAEVKRRADIFLASKGELTQADVKAIEKGAREYSLKQTKKWLYDIAEETDLAHMLRFVSPFYMAWQEVLTRWAHLIVRKPQIVGYGNLIWNTPERLGLVVDQDGNSVRVGDGEWGRTYIRVRLPEWAKSIPGLQSQGYMPINKNSLNLMLQGAPGFGPTVQIPANEVVKHNPTLEDRLKFFAPYGATDEPWWKQLLPAAYDRLVTSAQDPEDDRVFLGLVYNIYSTKLINYSDPAKAKGPRPSNREIWEESVSEAKSLQRLRFFGAMTMPFAPSFQSPYQKHIDIYRKLYAADPATADQKFYEQFGEEYFALTTRITENVKGIPSTQEAYAAEGKYHDLIAEHPDIAGLIVGSEGAGEFSRSVYVNQLMRGMREAKSPEELIVDSDVRVGWQKYRAMNDLIEATRIARGLPSLRVKGAQDLSAMKKILMADLAKKYPGWYDDYQKIDQGAMRRRIEGMRKVVEDPDLMRRPEIQTLAKYLQYRDLFRLVLAQRKKNGGSATLDATSNHDLAVLWDAVTGKLVEDDLSFADTYSRYLDRDTLED